MSVPFSGALRRSGGLMSAIGKQTKLVNLKGVQRITVTFDPFHESAIPTRDFLFQLSCPKIALTNANCTLRTNIECDRRPPTIEFQLIPSVQEQVKFKKVVITSDNLTTLELLQLTNQHVTPLAPKEEVVNVVKTKSEKKSAGGVRKLGGTKRK